MKKTEFNNYMTTVLTTIQVHNPHRQQGGNSFNFKFTGYTELTDLQGRQLWGCCTGLYYIQRCF